MSGDKTSVARTPIDATIKLKYKRPKTGQWGSPLDPYDIELSFKNLYIANSRYGGYGSIHIGGEWIKGIENIFIVCSDMLSSFVVLKSVVKYDIYQTDF